VFYRSIQPDNAPLEPKHVAVKNTTKEVVLTVYMH